MTVIEDARYALRVLTGNPSFISAGAVREQGGIR
jgi:hypothetical protein